MVHANPSPKETATLDVSHPWVKDEIRNIILDTLQGCDITYPTKVEECKEFQAGCMEEAIRRGYNMKGRDVILKYLIPPGAEAAYLFYPHLRKKHNELLTLIGLYFAWLFYIDDAFDRHYDAICEFNDRFVNARPQRARALNQFAEIITEMSYFYTGPAANLIISGSLDFVTGTLIEHVTREEKVHPKAAGFPAYMKTLVSANRPLCIMAFPPDMPIKHYVQAIPEMLDFANNFSDVLSFYKEDLENEFFNRISHLSRTRRVSKLEVLRDLANEAVQSYNHFVNILSASPASPQTAKEFFFGALAIHVSAARYKFDDLNFV